MRITNSGVNQIKAPDSGYQIHYDDTLPGFGVRVTNGGAKSYVIQGRVNGKVRRVTLGRHGVITADQARKAAMIMLAEFAAGTDPTAKRRAQRSQAVTLREIADDYKINRRTAQGLPLKDSTKKDIDKHLNGIFKDWASQPITAITREKFARRYTEHCKRSVAQAEQARRVLSALINYAAAKFRDADDRPIILENPVRVIQDASMRRSVKPRNNAIPLDRLGAWWSALQELRADPAKLKVTQAMFDLTALLLLTGLRIGEGRSLKWDQIDLDKKTLTLSDTKNRTDVTLPLSEQAVKTLSDRPTNSDWVFPARSGSGHLSDIRGALLSVKESTGIEVTAHDLRRSFRAVAAACGIELWRTKALMNHKQNQDITLSAYTDLSNVTNLKPEADRIGEYIEAQRAQFEASNVVPFKGKQR